MATKPVTLPRIWADGGTYTNGPFVGSIMSVDPGAGIATQGHRPGAADPTAAEHQNYQQLWESRWINNWLATSSSAGASDTHLVETTATGRTGLTGLDVNNTATESGVISITNGGTLPSFFGRNEVGPVYRAVTINGPGPAFVGALAGTAVGLNLSMTGVSPTGAGVKITANAATTASAIVVDHNGTDINFYAVEISSESAKGVVITSTANNALWAISGVNDQETVRIQNNGTGSGLTVSVTNPAIGEDCILATARGDGAGLHINQAAAGDPFAGVGILIDGITPRTGIRILQAAGATPGFMHGIFCQTVETIAILGDSQDNYGVQASSSNSQALHVRGDQFSPVYGEVLFEGQDIRPSNTNAGQLSYIETENQFAHTLSGQWRGMWSSTGGYCQGIGSDTRLLNAGLGIYTSFTNVALTGGNAPKVANRPVTIRITLFGWRGAPGTDDFNIRLRDVTSNTVLPPGGFTLAGLGLGFSKAFAGTQYNEQVATIIQTVSPTAAGNRTYRVEVACLTSSVVTMTAQLEILGQN